MSESNTPTTTTTTTTSTSRNLNPFSKRSDFSSQSLLLYKITTSASWLLFLISAWYYVFNAPHKAGHDNDDDNHHHHDPHARFWQHNYPTPFAQSSLLTSLYWLLLFTLQLIYPYALSSSSSSSSTLLHPAANLAAHYIAHNLLLFGFVHLWVRSHFWLAELLLVVNFGNLSTAYFRHTSSRSSGGGGGGSTTPRLLHTAALSGPLAWTFVALYWCGAVAVHTNHVAARILANVFIWGWVAYGGFFLVAYQDYTMGFALSMLSFSTATGQFLTKPHLVQLQWIFAFAIAGLLFLLTLAVAIPGLLGDRDRDRSLFSRAAVVAPDRERAPLLAAAGEEE